MAPAAGLVFDAPTSENALKNGVAREVNIHTDQLDEFIFGMIVAEIPRSPTSNRPARQRPILRLVN